MKPGVAVEKGTNAVIFLTGLALVEREINNFRALVSP
jgi:hypothetical protein